MDEKPLDITPYERILLSALKKRPGMYLGTATLTKFWHQALGYSLAMGVVGERNAHNILPGGLAEHISLKYFGSKELISCDCAKLILKREPDEKKAFYLFFELLDEYLISLGYKPIPEFDDRIDGGKLLFAPAKVNRDFEICSEGVEINEKDDCRR